MVCTVLITDEREEISPLRVHKEAWKAYVEWRHYMTEMYTNKKAEISTGASGKNLDLMGKSIHFPAPLPSLILQGR